MSGVTRDVVLGQDSIRRIVGALRRDRQRVVEIVASTPEDLGRIRAAAGEEREAIAADMETLRNAISIRATVPETPGGEG